MRNLALTNGLIVAERVSIVLGPLLGKEQIAEIIRAAGRGEDLATLIDEALVETGTTSVDVRSLLDPGRYTGLAADLVDRALTRKDETP